MKKEPLFVALSNQKGGVGKSTLTVLLASYFHYHKAKNVLVVDCDYPQHSMMTMREWDIKNVEKTPRLQSLLVEQFGDTGRKAYNILASTPEQAKETAYGFIDRSDTEYDLVLLDLPGTVNTTGGASPSSIWTMFLPRSPRRGWSCRAACHLSCRSGNICFITRESPCVISICSGIKWTSASPGTCMTLIWKSSVLWDYLY